MSRPTPSTHLKTGPKRRKRAGSESGTETTADGTKTRSGRHRKRPPVFRWTPTQVIERCRAKHYCLVCAGQVLALRDLMQEFGWNISELAGHSGVSRSMISEVLSLDTLATTPILNALAESFGLELFAFGFIAHLALLGELPDASNRVPPPCGEVSPWRH